MTARPVVLVSVSGGRTSGYMARRIQTENLFPWADVHYIFANTGEEHDKTLDFVRRIGLEWKLPVVWIETVVHPIKGIGSTFKVVTYETASRSGQPFEDVIKKYGIPNRNYPHCSRELKAQPIAVYARVTFPGRSVYMAIGIRADEMDRMDSKADKKRYLYPLVGLGVTKEDVGAFWASERFDLGLPDYLGNCVWCWKKSNKKLTQVSQTDGHVFLFPAAMEQMYSSVNSDRPRTFFRGNLSALDFLKGNIDSADDTANGGCSGEACEPFPDFDNKEM